MIKNILLIIFFIFSTNVSAMEFEFVEFYKSDNDHPLPKKLRMSGEIVQGDLDKLIKFLNSLPVAEAYFGFGQIELDSNGGDVNEAMKLAEFMKDAFSLITVKKNCASSCTLLWLTGYPRMIGDRGRVGIHRPTFNESYYQETSLENTKNNYEKLTNKFKDYLINQGLPTSLYEKMMSIDSENIYWLNSKDLNLIGSYPRYFEESLLKNCSSKKNPNPSNSQEPTEYDVRCFNNLKRPQRIKFFDNFYDKKNYEWQDFKNFMSNMN